VHETAAGAAAADELAAEPVTTPVAGAAAQASTAAQQAVPAPIAPAPVPKADLEAIIAGAGLQWVETSASAVPEEAPAEVPAPRVPRVRRPRSAPSGEPLQQVETRHDG